MLIHFKTYFQSGHGSMALSQPNSLQALAGKATAALCLATLSPASNTSRFKGKLKPKCLKKEFDALAIIKVFPQIQKFVIPFYKGAELADYIDSYEGLLNLKEKCINEDLFQHFILNFFSELENETTHLISLSRLNRHYFKFCSDLSRKKNGEFDWVNRALGFDVPILPEMDPIEKQQQKFFKIKFGMNYGLDVDFGRYPIPVVPELLKHLIPLTLDFSFGDFYFENLYSDNERQAYPSPQEEPSTLSEQFFMRLGAMGMCLENNALHECLAFAAELLGSTDFACSLFLDRFFIHVWGLLAVCLAKLKVYNSLIFSCLAEVDKRVIFESDKIDSMYYRQQASAAIGDYTTETKMFTLIFKNVTRYSTFFYMSFLLHIESQLQLIEDLVMEMYVLKQIKNTSSLENRTVIVYNVIQETRRLLHFFFSKNGYAPKTYPQMFELFDVLSIHELVVDLLLDKKIMSFQNRQKVNNITRTLQESKFPLIHFLNSFTFGHDLMQTLDALHNELKITAHCENPILFSHVVFTHAILVKFIQKSGSLHYATEAKLIYGKTNSHRTVLLHDFMYYDLQSKPKFTLPKFDEQVISNFNIVTLFELEPLLPKLACFGIESLKRFDSFLI